MNQKFKVNVFKFDNELKQVNEVISSKELWLKN